MSFRIWGSDSDFAQMLLLQFVVLLHILLPDDTVTDDYDDMRMHQQEL
jgi:hypothetical protein